MNARVISSFLLIAISVSIALFYRKHQKEIHSIDRVASSLAGLKKKLPANCVIYIQYQNADVEVFQDARNVLVPFQLIRANGSLHDTMLDIISTKEVFHDSLWNSLGYSLLWQNKDSAFVYSLVIHQP